jgi:hypothetical protein
MHRTRARPAGGPRLAGAGPRRPLLGRLRVLAPPSQHAPAAQDAAPAAPSLWPSQLRLPGLPWMNNVAVTTQEQHRVQEVRLEAPPRRRGGPRTEAGAR